MLPAWKTLEHGKRITAANDYDGAVHGCAWSPDSSKALTASSDGTAKVWNAATGELLLTLDGHSMAVRGCAWSPDGSKVLTASDDGTANVWNAATGQKLQSLKRHTISAFNSCAWSPDSSKVLTTSDDKTASVWDAYGQDFTVRAEVYSYGKSSMMFSLQGHTDAVKGCAWSPDGSKLLTASDDRTAKVWDAATGRVLLTLQGHNGAVTGCAWSPDGCSLLTASQDFTARVSYTGLGERLTLTLQVDTPTIGFVRLTEELPPSAVIEKLPLGLYSDCILGCIPPLLLAELHEQTDARSERLLPGGTRSTAVLQDPLMLESLSMGEGLSTMLQDVSMGELLGKPRRDHQLVVGIIDVTARIQVTAAWCAPVT